MASGRYLREQRPSRDHTYYTYGNVAYDVRPEPIPYYNDEEEERRLAALEQERRMIVRENRIVSLKMIAVVVVLFIGCIAFMSMHVRVANANVALRSERSRLAEMKAVNAILETELIEQMDLDYIKEQATTRLGMAEPQAYQMVYLNVPKQSYTIQYAADTVDTAEEETLLSQFTKNLKKE